MTSLLHQTLRVDVAGVSNTVALTDRVRMRREEYLKAVAHICSARAHLATLSWQETEGKPIVIRRARLLERILQGIPIAINDGELIVGSQTRYVRGASPCLDFNSAYGSSVVGDKITTRGEAVGAVVSDEDRQTILQDAAYWNGRAPADIISEVTREVFGPQIDAIINGAKLSGPFEEGLAYPRSVDFDKVLRQGLKGVIAECCEEIGKLSLETTDEVEKLWFLQAAIIVLQATVDYAKRYAGLAREMALKEGDPVRRHEIEKIAEACEWVPENPPRDFHEALQSFRFIHLVLNLETSYANEVPGRMDQYLFPYYAEDIASGRLTRQEAAELLGCLWIKFAEMDCVKIGYLRAATQGNHGIQITIGGVDRGGRDATNELSYLILHVTGQVRLPQPAVFVRWHDDIPHELMVKAIETNRLTAGGIPGFLNDKHQVPVLLTGGVSVADARDYAAFGCVHPYIPHSSGQFKVYPVMINSKCLEITLNDGIDPRTGKQAGLSTGDPRGFVSFEELYGAFIKQYTYFVDFMIRYANMAWHVRETCYALPFNSALLNDCIKNGRDALRGGTRYPQHALAAFNRGIQNAADSLTTIKKLVFEEKKITMDELLQALACNFEGKEGLRQMLLAAPKYGNDDDYADEIMRRVSIDTMEILQSHRNPYGYPVRDLRNGAATHYSQGRVVGALPDGRKAWEPLADASLSPMRGADKRGPTAVISSAAKVIDPARLVSANLNQRFSAAMVQTPEQIEKVISLIETYFGSLLGPHIQFNILSRELLLEAKNHPERYRDLVVRIGGYSAFWVELTPEMQDEIIARTEQSF